MVRRTSIAKLKAHLSEYIDAARAGEEIIVTDRNKPLAKLGPVVAAVRGEARLLELVRAGLARPPMHPLPKDLWDRPRPQDPNSLVLRALLDERAEGR